MVSRRQFLRGGFSRSAPVRRPPWHVAETAFTSRCTRCDDCLKACPTQILVRGSAGFPEVDFSRGECTFCADCARSCDSGALAFNPEVAPWELKAVIGDGCLTYRQTVCRSCGEACPVRAIRFSPVLGGAAEPVRDADACTGCGACVGVCPARAVSVDPAPVEFLRKSA